MSRLLDNEQDELPQRERELTLSTGAILAIFLGLVLLCAVFFGFGYNLGRKSTTATEAVPTETNETQPAGTTGTFDSFKMSPASRSAATGPKSTPAAAEEAPPPAIKDKEPESPNPHPAPPTPPSTHTAASATTAAVPTHAAPPVLPAASPSGSFIVQIAAISATHKDDADLLAGALRGRGYTAVERTDAQDKLIHVQVGPFATKADAEAMRERLVVDGYNPIIK